MKIVLFVEGHTERKALAPFLKRWLDPQLPQPMGIKVVRFEGWRDYYGEIDKKVQLNLSGKSGQKVVGAIGLLDLYGPTFYPSDVKTVEERYEWGKAHIEKRVDHSRFRQHFAVHETEAWLLSDPLLLPKKVSAALPSKASAPETVNFDQPPAKLLGRLYGEKLRRTYKKVTDGANLFRQLDPNVASRKCPHLKRVLTDMLALATQGQDPQVR